MMTTLLLSLALAPRLTLIPSAGLELAVPPHLHAYGGDPFVGLVPLAAQSGTLWRGSGWAVAAATVRSGPLSEADRESLALMVMLRSLGKRYSMVGVKQTHVATNRSISLFAVVTKAVLNGVGAKYNAGASAVTRGDVTCVVAAIGPNTGAARAELRRLLTSPSPTGPARVLYPRHQLGKAPLPHAGVAALAKYIQAMESVGDADLNERGLESASWILAPDFLGRGADGTRRSKLDILRSEVLLSAQRPGAMRTTVAAVTPRAGSLDVVLDTSYGEEKPTMGSHRRHARAEELFVYRKGRWMVRAAWLVAGSYVEKGLKVDQ